MLKEFVSQRPAFGAFRGLCSVFGSVCCPNGSVVSFDSALPQEQGGRRLFRFGSTAPRAFDDDGGRTLIVAGSFDSTAPRAPRFPYGLGRLAHVRMA